MEVSNVGINLIKKFEGLRLEAYKAVPSEKYWTIGYGHYGSDVWEGMTITEEQATTYLKQDLQTAVKAVNSLKREWTQNQFDALVSFTYNCGIANLKKLTSGRSASVIADKIPLYNQSGGKKLNGLVRRRAEERALFIK